jgi:hypothetical protein
MAQETKQQAESHQERAETADKTHSVDFAHPEIMRARAAVYALLLQWARERKEKEATAQTTSAHQSDEQASGEHVCENSESEYTDRNQNPTPAVTEVGQR